MSDSSEEQMKDENKRLQELEGIINNSRGYGNIPRRICIPLFSVGEMAIHKAMEVVESVGADVRLTDAVSLLGAAQTRVADFIDKTYTDLGLVVPLRDKDGNLVQSEKSKCVEKDAESVKRIKDQITNSKNLIPGTAYVELFSDDVNQLIGVLKTIIDVAITNEHQSPCVKSLIQREVWLFADSVSKSPQYLQLINVTRGMSSIPPGEPAVNVS
jgi:hypothetical protein